MVPDELLSRLAVTLRREIGPGVGDTYLRTQAFMAAVVLEKLSAQLRLAPAHAEAAASDRAALLADLAAELQGATAAPAPAPVTEAVAALRAAPAGDDDALSSLVRALYASADELGADRFARLLARVRATLRASLDRQLAYAS